MQKTKILAFDSWTAGCRNFARLVPALRQFGYEPLLVHIGSWGHDRNRPKEEVIDGLLVRDIAYYEDRGFDAILRRENPACVLFLSLRAFAHMAFNRYAAQANIPSVHLYHGLVAVQDTGSSAGAYRVNLASQVKLAIQRSWKNATKLLPVYVVALLRTRAALPHWYWFFREIYLKAAFGGHRGIAPLDCTTTAGCVYTKADVSHMAETYQVDPKWIFPVGNPDLVRFHLTPDQIGSRCGQCNAEQAWVVYIDTALLDSGFIFVDRKDFANHLRLTSDSLRRQGYRFTLKLHPAAVKSGLAQYIESEGHDICSEEQFLQRLSVAAAAIVEPSSAAMVPALLGLPLLLARYGKLNGQSYGRVLTSYPRATHLENIDKAAELVAATANDRELFQAWVDENAGPLPAEDMPNRVATAISQVVRAHHEFATPTRR